MGYTRREAGIIWVSLGVVIFGLAAFLGWEGCVGLLMCGDLGWFGLLLLFGSPGLVALAVGFTYLALSLRETHPSPSPGK